MRGSLLVVVTLAACATVPPPLASRDATVLRVTDAVLPPYRLEALVVTIDGEVVGRAAGEVRVPLPKGPHELALAARVSRPCELSGERVEVTRVRAATLLEIGELQATLEAEVAADLFSSPGLTAELDGAPLDVAAHEPGCCSLELTEPRTERLTAAPACPDDAPRSAPRVLVTGQVLRPSEVPWQPGMTAYEAIAAAGGRTHLANLRYTQVRRRCGARLVVLDLPWYASVTALDLKAGDEVLVQMTPEP